MAVAAAVLVRAITLFGSASAQTAVAADPPTRIAPNVSAAVAPSVWKADTTLFAKLDAPQAFGAIALRPPLGYKPQVGSAPMPDVVAKAWVGDAREDGTRPYISLLVVPKSAPGARNMTPSQVLSRFEAGVARRRTEWQESPVESGLINGLPAVRARWSGTDTANGAKMFGFGYVVAVTAGFVYISSQDVEPHAKAALEIAEASALTLYLPPPTTSPILRAAH